MGMELKAIEAAERAESKLAMQIKKELAPYDRAAAKKEGMRQQRSSTRRLIRHSARRCSPSATGNGNGRW